MAARARNWRRWLVGALGALGALTRAEGLYAEELKEQKPAPIVTGAPGKGVTIRTGDEFSMTLRGRTVFRDTLAWGAGETTNELGLRTLRVMLGGNMLVPELRYLIQLAFGANDFEAGNPSPIFDAYLEYTRFRDLNVRFGQFFVPFDRGRTIREFALQFVDRAQVIQELNLDRDVGLMLSSGNLFGTRVLGYNAFVGSGKGRNRVGGVSPVGFLYLFRFNVRPFGEFDDDTEGDLLRLPKPRLLLGLVQAYNQHTNRQRSTFGTTLSLGTVNYLHQGVDALFKYAGFSFLGEFLYRHGRPARLTQSANGETKTEWTRSGYGYLLQAGMMLTKNFELTGRYDELFTFGETDPALVKLVAERGKELAFGLNLYLNGHFFKFQADYVRAWASSDVDATELARFALDATF